MESNHRGGRLRNNSIYPCCDGVKLSPVRGRGGRDEAGPVVGRVGRSAPSECGDCDISAGRHWVSAPRDVSARQR